MQKSIFSYRNLLTGAISLVTLAMFFCVIFNVFPLGIPEEWIYPHNKQGMFSFAHLIYGFLIFAFVCILANQLYTNGKPARNKIITIFSIILIASSFFDIQVLKSGRMGMGENLLAIYDPYTTGYYQKALEIKSVSKYMSGFHKQQTYKGFVNHSDVHPPGRPLISYMLYRGVKACPPLKSFLLETMPVDISDMYRQIEENDLLPYFTLTEEVKAAGVLHIYMFLFFLFCARLFFALALWKLFGTKVATGFSIIYMFVPSPILFIGHYDVLLATISTLLMFYALLTRDMKNKYLILGNIAAGILCAALILQTVAVAVCCLWLVLFFLLAYNGKSGKQHFYKVFVYYYLPYGLGILISMLLMQLLFSFNLPKVLFTCLHNNAIFFKSQCTRSILWKFLNPAEFFTVSGLSCSLLLLAGAFEFLRRKFKKPGELQFPKQFHLLNEQQAAGLSSALCILFLFFTPTNAEVARLWILAWPFVYILTIKTAILFHLRFSHLVILGTLLVTQTFIFRFFVEIVLIRH